jgi:hypothetical protein
MRPLPGLGWRSSVILDPTDQPDGIDPGRALGKAAGKPLNARQALSFAVEPILPPGAAPPGG